MRPKSRVANSYPVPQGEGLGIKGDIEIGMDGHQFLGQQGQVPVILKTLSVALPADLISVLQKILHRSILSDQILGPLLPNSGDSWNIVHTVPHQGEDIDHLIGWHPKVQLYKFRRVQLLSPGMKHRDVRPHQLHEVFVRRDEHHIEALLGRSVRHGTQDIVGLVLGQLEFRNAIGIQELSDPRDLDLQIFWSRRPVGFVRSVTLFPDRIVRDVEPHTDQFRLLFAQQLAQHVVEAVHRVGWLALRVRQVTDRIERTKDIGIPINQKESRTLHGANCSAVVPL